MLLVQRAGHLRAHDAGADERLAVAGGDGALGSQERVGDGSLRDADVARLASSDGVDFSGASFSGAAALAA